VGGEKENPISPYILGDPTLAQIIIIIIIIIINLLPTYGNFGKKNPCKFGTSFSEKYFV